MNLNIPHLHLLFNHVPTVGTVVAFGLLLLGYVRRNEHLRNAGLEIFFLIAVLTWPVYLTGVSASRTIAGQAGVSAPMMDVHHNAAILGFLMVLITGAAAWLALWQIRRGAAVARTTTLLVALLAVLAIGFMGRAALVGGDIRHPEIRVAQADASKVPPFPGTSWLTSGVIADFVHAHSWVWPACETVHFLGLSLIVGVLLTINLRLLGAMRAVPFAAVHRLLPWGLLGLAINVLTGMVFFIAQSDEYIHNGAFWIKTVFLVLTGFNFLYLTVYDKIWTLDAGSDARLADKAMAVCSLVGWFGVIYGGRVLPFFGGF
jgi:hypothetical protein